MKFLFKTTTFLLLTTIFFQSCDPEEPQEEIVSNLQEISTGLSKKIITTATSLNDYNFFVSNAAKSNCDFIPNTWAYFNNPEGYYYNIYLGSVESLDMWLKKYEDAKLQAFNTTGVKFTDEDFFISNLSFFNGIGGMATRESFLEYFENCNFRIDDAITSDDFLFASEINFNCNNNVVLPFFIIKDDGTSTDRIGSINLSTGDDISSVEVLLNDFNIGNNTNYSMDNVRLIGLNYVSPNGEEVLLFERERTLNYFENCMLSRDDSVNDYLNFVYPIQINQNNLQIIETIENDEDLIVAFNTNAEELSFVYPINLIGQDGSILVIETNEALENALDNSSQYSN